jgi:stage II sporulation protein AB (anti-sigma F factor)
MNTVNLKIAAYSENVSLVRVMAAAFVASLDPTVDELSDIKTAVSEAVTNAIIHGYGEGEGIVSITMSLSEKTLNITVKDSGAGIENVTQAREPLFTTKPEMERSGLGFTVMENFMTSVEVESAPGVGTTVKMTKKIGNG